MTCQSPRLSSGAVHVTDEAIQGRYTGSTMLQTKTSNTVARAHTHTHTHTPSPPPLPPFLPCIGRGLPVMVT